MIRLIALISTAALFAMPVSAEVKHSVLASGIVRAVQLRDADLFRDVISERSTLANGHERGDDVMPERIFAELEGCEVNESIEANHSANVVVGGEPRVWWVCAKRKPVGCFDVGYFAFWSDEGGRVFRLMKSNPRNFVRCPMTNSGLVIPNG